jgi:hypothetical protein
MRNKIIIVGIASAAFAATLPLSVFAADPVLNPNANTRPELVESGTVDVQAEQIRLIIGGAKGTGVLHFGGKDYKFKLSGASAGGVGVTKIDATGTVYNLKNIKDFAGNYSGATVGASLVKGTGASSWENPKGVVVSMKSKSTEGVALNLGLSAVTIELAK